MATTKPGSIATRASTVVRSEVTVGDDSAINDTNYPPANLTHGAGWKRVMLFPRFVSGSAPKVTLRILHRASDTWVLGEMSQPLADGETWVTEVAGRDFYVRLFAITGTPTNVSIHCSGWDPFKFDGGAAG